MVAALLVFVELEPDGLVEPDSLSFRDGALVVILFLVGLLSVVRCR